MLLKTRRSRALLLKYSGYTHDRKCLKNSSDLTLTEFRELKSLLHKEGASPLADLLERLWQETRKCTSPQVYREFFCELSKSTPVCGMLQAAGNQDALQIVNAIATGSFDVANSANHRQLSILQEHVPILCSFLVKCLWDEDNHLPSDVCRIPHLLAELMVAPFTVPTSGIYPPPQPDSPLSFFPNLPQLYGDALYAADIANQASTDSNSCRKNAYGHPTLSPGVFTIFCIHGVCYGFAILKSHESPKHPFSIFKTCFQTAPKMIIYDNCCKLHAYCLNREPVFFQNTCS